MTKSTGVGRGGKRPGAGRKPKHSTTAKATEQVVQDAAKAARTASDLVEKAYATLEDVMDNSPFPAPRVSAAKAVIELAKEEAAPAAAGKKAQRQANAERATSGGRFAVRQPPKMVVDNTR